MLARNLAVRSRPDALAQHRRRLGPGQRRPVARLATVDAAGQPHLVPCCFVLDGLTAYSAVDDKPKRSPRLQRLANVQGRPVASLLIDEYSEDWTALWWIRAGGPARV